MKVLIITAGRYPVPAVKGGAIATLIEHLITGNSKEKLVDMEITSPYDINAELKAIEFRNCKFHFIKTPEILKKIDNFIYFVFSNIFKNKNLISLKSMLSFGWFILQNARILNKGNYDKIIVENTARMFLCFKLFGNKKIYKGRYYYHLHNEPKKLGGCRAEILDCEKILCISNYIKNSIVDIKSSLALKDSNKAEILYNCVDTSVFRSFDKNKFNLYYEKWGLKPTDRVVVFSGRIDAEKGIRELLKAMKLVKTENIKLLIVGSSFYGMNITTQFEKEILELSNSISEQVIFTGFVPHNEMPYVYNIGKIAVLPSMWEEPAGLTIIESMACGTPVITTKSGGIVEYTNKECSIILERDENLIKNIAAEIDNLLNDKELYERLKVNGQDHIKMNFSSNMYMNKLYDLINT